MVLVGHYPVDARFISEGVLLVVLVIQHVGFFGIEEGVRKAKTPGIVLVYILLFDVDIGLLGVEEDLNSVDHDCLLRLSLKPRLIPAR